MKVASKKAVGTIIGGVFILLIFSSIIATFVVIDFYNQSRDDASISRTEFYNEKSRENIRIISVVKKDNNYLNITVCNIGNTPTKITYIGELNESSGNRYYKTDLFLKPLETSIDIIEDRIKAEDNEAKKLQLLTSYGNQYFYMYNEDSGTGEPVNYNLFISAIGEGSTNPSLGMHLYEAGSNVNISAIPSSGWSFSQWIVDGFPDGSSVPISVRMDSNHSVEAVFTQSMITLLEDYFEDFGYWELTNWQIQNDQYYSVSNSAKSDSSHKGDLQTLTLDTSQATSLNIEFWYRLSGGIDSNDVAVQLYDGVGGPDTIVYLDGLEDTWRQYNFTTTDPQYFITDFYLRFYSNLNGGEMIWIDDIKITITE